MRSTLALLLLVAPAAPPLAAAQGQDWHALPAPDLCREPEAAPQPAPLLSGNHLGLPEDDDPAWQPGRGALLPLPALVSVLDEEGRRAGGGLQIHSSFPPILVRGSGDEVEGVEALLAGLQREAERQRVHVRAWILPASEALGAVAGADEVARALADVPVWAETLLRPGEDRALGERRAQPFVSGYRVEVAADAGVANPRIGLALSGTTLHVRACPAEGGRAVHLQAFLDAAELWEVDTFHSSTPDLGLFQQPRVHAVQVAFGGRVESGGALCARLEGTGRRGGDLCAILSATLAPSPEPGDPPAWRLLDVSLLETRVESLPVPLPGTGLELEAPEGAGQMLLQSMPASALVQAADRSGGAGGRSRLQWAPGLVFGPADDREGWGEVESLVGALEAARLSTRRLEIRSGKLRAVFPVAEGLPARLMVGSERTWVVDYDVQVAPETWMPDPRVERAFDGILVQGHLSGQEWLGAGWRSITEGSSLISRNDLLLGTLQLPSRSMTGGRARARIGSRVRLLGPPPGSAEGALTLELAAP